MAFHCQQAAEKHLKAALVNRHIKPPRTHHLGTLLLRLTKAGYRTTNELASSCKRLDKYAVDARYPNMLVHEAAGRRAVADCQRVVDEARGWMS